MTRTITLRWSDEEPRAPHSRYIESLARADRRSLGCRFGEPIDPRKLVSLYDVNKIIETHEEYKSYYGSSVREDFSGLECWSGVLVQFSHEHIMLINPTHNKSRRTLTIAHEFGHLALSHKSVGIANSHADDIAGGHMRYSDEQELEAFEYGLSILLPYAPLLQMLRQNATLQSIARHYQVSVQALVMRMKLSSSWSLYRRPS